MRHIELRSTSVITENQPFHVKSIKKVFSVEKTDSKSFNSSCWTLICRRPLWQAGTSLETQEEEYGQFTDRHLRIWVSDTQMLWLILAQPTTGTHLDYTWETRLDTDTQIQTHILTYCSLTKTSVFLRVDFPVPFRPTLTTRGGDSKLYSTMSWLHLGLFVYMVK